MMLRHIQPLSNARRADVAVFALATGLSFITTACDGNRTSDESAWRERQDSVSVRTITGIESACANCIELLPVVTLGTDKEKGALEDNGPLGRVVRDLEGRYWAAQKNFVKVFAANGDFVATVGRRGAGPMEFEFAEPVHVDATGLIHVLDLRAGRETIVRPDFTLESDRKIVGQFDQIEALPGDSNRYVIAKWHASPGQSALPLHVISGMDIIHSFGLAPGADTSVATPGSSPRLIAVTRDSYVLSSMVDKYFIEAWAADGAQVAGFELPGFNPAEVRPGRWAMDNPPPNFIGDLGMFDERHLVVLSHHRRPNWKELVVEKVSSDGKPYVTPADDQVPSVYRSRIDVLDLNTAAIIASTWHDGYLLRMIDRDAITRIDYDTDGIPTLAILRMTFRAR